MTGDIIIRVIEGNHYESFEKFMTFDDVTANIIIISMNFFTLGRRNIYHVRSHIA